MDRDNKSDIAVLAQWFSAARMKRYASASDPVALYVWNERLSKAYLEDVAHVEVLLRNFIASRLATDCLRRCGDCAWYDHPGLYNLKEPFAHSVERVKGRLVHEGKTARYDGVIAGFSMDVWRFLLVKRLEPTVWRALRDQRNGGMPHHPGTSRSDFESRVATVYNLRNRCSHQEHLVMRDVGAESLRLDTFSNSLHWIAEHIDPDAAAWIDSMSRVAAVRLQRPR